MPFEDEEDFQPNNIIQSKNKSLFEQAHWGKQNKSFVSFKTFSLGEQIMKKLSTTQIKQFNRIQILIFQLSKDIQINLENVDSHQIKLWFLNVQDISDQIESLCKNIKVQYIFGLFQKIMHCIMIIVSKIQEKKKEKSEVQQNVKMKTQKYIEKKQIKQSKSTKQFCERNQKKMRRIKTKRMNRQGFGGVSLYLENYKNKIETKLTCEESLKVCENERLFQKELIEELEKYTEIVSEKAIKMIDIVMPFEEERKDKRNILNNNLPIQANSNPKNAQNQLQSLQKKLEILINQIVNESAAVIKTKITEFIKKFTKFGESSDGQKNGHSKQLNFESVMKRQKQLNQAKEYKKKISIQEKIIKNLNDMLRDYKMKEMKLNGKINQLQQQLLVSKKKCEAKSEDVDILKLQAKLIKQQITKLNLANVDHHKRRRVVDKEVQTQENNNELTNFTMNNINSRFLIQKNLKENRPFQPKKRKNKKTLTFTASHKKMYPSQQHKGERRNNFSLASDRQKRKTKKRVVVLEIVKQTVSFIHQPQIKVKEKKTSKIKNILKPKKEVKKRYAQFLSHKSEQLKMFAQKYHSLHQNKYQDEEQKKNKIERNSYLKLSKKSLSSNSQQLKEEGKIKSLQNDKIIKKKNSRKFSRNSQTRKQLQNHKENSRKGLLACINTKQRLRQGEKQKQKQKIRDKQKQKQKHLRRTGIRKQNISKLQDKPEKESPSLYLQVEMSKIVKSANKRKNLNLTSNNLNLQTSDFSYQSIDLQKEDDWSLKYKTKNNSIKKEQKNNSSHFSLELLQKKNDSKTNLRPINTTNQKLSHLLTINQDAQDTKQKNKNKKSHNMVKPLQNLESDKNDKDKTDEVTEEVIKKKPVRTSTNYRVKLGKSIDSHLLEEKITFTTRNSVNFTRNMR